MSCIQIALSRALRQRANFGRDACNQPSNESVSQVARQSPQRLTRCHTRNQLTPQSINKSPCIAGAVRCMKGLTLVVGVHDTGCIPSLALCLRDPTPLMAAQIPGGLATGASGLRQCECSALGPALSPAQGSVTHPCSAACCSASAGTAFVSLITSPMGQQRDSTLTTWMGNAAKLPQKENAICHTVLHGTW